MGVLASDSMELNSVIGEETLDNKTSGLVEADHIISAINQSTEGVSISGEKISLEGTVTANNNFKINRDGSMETIAGDIGGWFISENGFYRFYSIDVGTGTETQEPTEWTNSRNFLMRMVANTDYERPGIEYYQLDVTSPSDAPGLVLDPRFDYKIVKVYDPILGDWNYTRYYPSIPGEGHTADEIISIFKTKYNLFTIYDPLRALFYGVDGARDPSTGEPISDKTTAITANELYFESNNQSSNTNLRIAANFLSAANGSRYMDTSPSEWGRIYESMPANKSIESGKDITLAKLTLPAGTFMINGSVQYPSNSTGARELHLSTSNNGTAMDRFASSGHRPVGGAGICAHKLSYILTNTSQRTIYLCAYQTSGKELTGSLIGLRAVRLV